MIWHRSSCASRRLGKRLPALARLAVLVAMETAMAAAIQGPTLGCVDYSEYAHQIAFVDLPEHIRNVAIDGNHLFAATPTRLHVFEISDPRDPDPIADLDLVLEARTMVVSNGHIFIAGGTSGLAIIKAIDPSQPRVVAHLASGLDARDIALVEGLAFVAAGADGLMIYDVSEPSAPRAIGRRVTPEPAVRVTAYDSLVSIIVGAEVYTFSVANPERPVFISKLRVTGGLQDVASMASSVVASDGTGLLFFDPLSFSSDPPVIRTVRIPGGARRVTVVGECVFAAISDGYNNTLYMVDAGATIEPLLRGQVTVKGSYNDFAVDDRYACIAGGLHGLSMVDVSNPSTPPLLGRTPTGPQAFAVTVRDRYAYVVSFGLSYLWIADISDPQHPVRISSLQGTYDALAIAFLKNYAILAGASTGMHIADVSDPCHPYLIGSYMVAGQPSDVEVLGDYGVFATGSLRVVDLRDPWNPQFVGSTVPPGGASSLEIVGQYACTIGDQTVSMVDLSDPANPVTVGTVALDHGVRWLEVNAHIAVAASTFDFSVVDISDAANPRLMARYTAREFCHGIDANGRFVFAACAQVGTLIYDLSDPSHPIAAGNQDTPDYAYNVAVEDDFAYVADGSGLQVIHSQCAARSPSAVGLGAPASSVSWVPSFAYPVPFASQAMIETVLQTPGDLRLEILDSGGRIIRNLACGAHPAGRITWSWDGVTESGHRAAPGVYFYRIRSPSIFSSGRLIRIRVN